MVRAKASAGKTASTSKAGASKASTKNTTSKKAAPSKPTPKKVTKSITPKKVTKSTTKTTASKTKTPNPNRTPGPTTPSIYLANIQAQAKSKELAQIPSGDARWDPIRALYAGPSYDSNRPIQQRIGESDTNFMHRLWAEGQGLSDYVALPDYSMEARRYVLGGDGLEEEGEGEGRKKGGKEKKGDKSKVVKKGDKKKK